MFYNGAISIQNVMPLGKQESNHNAIMTVPIALQNARQVLLNWKFFLAINVTREYKNDARNRDVTINEKRMPNRKGKNETIKSFDTRDGNGNQ
ncbi:hypothetical protein CDAR_115921 [Caerostris darwini]|uniref:Uncharacterized protein n=1 Tax=Caerostris darwini TaxID=1538125 RepID=A0AAV4NAJ2_9ARAC|nr:hypothetical protein CDAR_115921 [Caerostris darwini]